MPNIASLLKDEIARVARKEVRGDTAALKTGNAVHRSEIAALKRRMQALEQNLRKVSKIATRARSDQGEEKDETAHRFSAKGLAMHRQRLGLSAKDLGALIDASALSVYKWEKGEVRPRAKHIAAIARLRTIGKKEAAARLADLAG